MLRLELAELSRDLALTRKLLPSMPHLAESILDLQKALALEKKVRRVMLDGHQSNNPSG
jgi:hypothetical protein